MSQKYVVFTNVRERRSLENYNLHKYQFRTYVALYLPNLDHKFALSKNCTDLNIITVSIICSSLLDK